MYPGPMMRSVLADILRGTILAAVAAGVSCLLALVGFGRPYYLSVFLPVSMLAYLLTAWLLYLHGDRFMGSPGAMRARTATTADPHPGPRAEADGPPEYLLRAAAGRAAGPLPDESRDRGPAFPRAKQALLWAAAELAVTATLLYSLWGIGAEYHG
jgi:hypothetical protein